MPTTFDEMMVNLGYHAERKEIKLKIEDLDKQLQVDLADCSTSELRDKILRIGENLKKLNYINNPYFKNM